MKLRVFVLGLLASACVEQNPDWLPSATLEESGSGGSATTTGAAESSATTATTTSGEGTTTGETGLTQSESSAAATDTSASATETGVQPGARRIFVSSVIHTGNLGGRAGGDALCQQRADAATLGGTWRVLISTSTESAAQALALDGPLVNLGGDVVAEGDADLWDGMLANPVGFDENGVANAGRAMTGTNPDGTATADLCDDWTTQVGGSKMTIGLASSTDGTWVANEDGACSQSYRYYCVED